MSRQLSDEERRNIQTRVKQLVVPIGRMTEPELESASGIPQTTINHIKLRAKVGISVARRLAAYLGEPVEDLLRGTQPAGHYSPRDTMHPRRGKLLDRLRGVVPDEVLDDVFAMRLPAGVPDWTEDEWFDEINSRWKTWKRMRNVPAKHGGTGGVDTGQP